MRFPEVTKGSVGFPIGSMSSCQVRVRGCHPEVRRGFVSGSLSSYHVCGHFLLAGRGGGHEVMILCCMLFREVPGGSVEFREVPGGSVEFREVPGGSARFREVPGGSVRFSEIQRDSARFSEVQRGSGRLSEVLAEPPAFRKIPGALGVRRRRTEERAAEVS